MAVAISGPLAGVRLVEFDAIGPVPLAAMILADMGCDIVRIGRKSAAPLGALGAAILQRGRSLVTLDLKVTADRNAALALIAEADGLLEGARPGVMERLGLGPEDCHAANPRLVYGRMTGWGQEGPLATRAGHDINYIAVTGALHAIGPAEGPVAPLNLVGDYGGGALFLALGVVSAILSAQATGQGQVVDAAMTDGTATLMSMFYAFHGGGHWEDRRAANLLDGGAPFYRCYACADGGFVAVGALEPQFFAALIDGLGIEADRFVQHDRVGWPEMADAFALLFATRTRDDWAQQFFSTDACVTPVLSLAEAPRHPHNVARQTFASPAGIIQPMPAPRFSGTPSAVNPAEVTSVDAVLARWR